MKLILAEKPSVAKTIASFLGAKTRHNGYFEGNGYIITYAVGHLVSLYDMKDYDKDKYSGSWKMDNFPFIPQDKFKFKVESSKKDQFNIVKTLIHRDDIEYIINATDNDREGELIAFLIFLMAKNKKPVKRILVNEWTPQDITKGLQNLKDDEEMRNLQAAGYTRLITDWLIGINFTSIATLKYGNGKLLNIGRVILPTVKLIYDRDMEIKNFVPKTYFEIEGNFRCKNGEYKGKLIKNKNSKFDTPEEAKAIIGSITSKEATIIDKKVTTSKEYAPKLFSLTSLQGYITSKYSHFTSDKVLSVCQSLYEGKGKGGYSYLVSDDKEQYVVKQIHHEPCDYYKFGDKLQSEINDYKRLYNAGIKMPKMLDVDIDNERILKEYIEGNTIYQMVEEDKMKDEYILQVQNMCKILYPLNINIDYFPTNFIVKDEVLWYIDYECNEYMEQWNFENWGIKYWSKTKDFREYGSKR